MTLEEIERDFICIGTQVANRMQGLVKDIFEQYDCGECGRPSRMDDLLEHDAQDVARYFAFDKIWREMVNHPDYDSSSSVNRSNQIHHELVDT